MKDAARPRASSEIREDPVIPAARLGRALPARAPGSELPWAIRTAIGRVQLEQPIRDAEFDDDDDDYAHTSRTPPLKGQR